MNFAQEPRGDRQRLPQDGRWTRALLLASCAAAVASTPWPWLHLALTHVFDEPGYRSRIGSICALSCILLMLLTAMETRSRHTRAAVRPATAFVAAVTTFLLAIDAWNGPGHRSGLPLTWTAWFWFAFGCVLTASALSAWRMPRRRRLPPRA